jgi:protein phosphatase
LAAIYEYLLRADIRLITLIGPLGIGKTRLSIELSDPQSEAEGTAWWENLTEAGGEGMVVKPLAFIARERRKLLQPAVKCRGREYLRIIY